MVKYSKSILIGFLSIVFFYIIQFIGSSIFLICNFKNPLSYLKFSSHLHISANETALLILSGDIFIIIVVCILLFYLKHFRNFKIQEEFKLQLFDTKNLLVLIPVGIDIALFFSIFSSLILRMCNISISYNVRVQNQMNSIYAYVVIIIIGPIAEELIFRGFLFNYLDKTTNRIYAIIVSSIFLLYAMRIIDKGYMLFF